MAVMPLVPETKMADVGKLISLGNLLVWKVREMSVKKISIIPFNTFLVYKRKTCTQSIFSVCLSVFQIFLFLVSAHNYVRNFDFVPHIWNRLHDKDCLYIFSSSKHSFSYILTSSSQPHENVYSATFFFLVRPFQLDLRLPRTQPQKFRQTPKETNNQRGKRHMPSSTRCYISIYRYLT